MPMAFTGCSGDNPVHAGEDTAAIKYHETDNRDTGKTTTSTGDATMLDDGGSGGTRIEKDSTKTTAYKMSPVAAVSSDTSKKVAVKKDTTKK